MPDLGGSRRKLKIAIAAMVAAGTDYLQNCCGVVPWETHQEIQMGYLMGTPMVNLKGRPTILRNHCCGMNEKRLL